MVAKILAIDICKIDISQIALDLQKNYCCFLSSSSIEESLRIICTQFIDLVSITLPSKGTKLFTEFFSVLRQSCGRIPIVGIAENELTDISWLEDIEIDDVIFKNTDEKHLMLRINMLMKRKNIFDEHLISSLRIDTGQPKKIVSFFCDENFFDFQILENSEIVFLKKWPALNSEMENADLFIVNLNHEKALECCAGLRLREINKYKPIVLCFDADCEQKALEAINRNVGYSDIIDIRVNKIITLCRLNSLIKYKKFYEAMFRYLKKSLFMSAIDSTTEVYNRSFFDNYLESKRYESGNFAILMIDIDKFKNINDKFGHAFADSMLRYVSGMIKKHVRESDIIARYGGDEFIIVMKNVTENTAGIISERIQKQIENTLFQGVNCTVSIGVCYASSDNVSMKDAITIADKFMYIAKQNGGNAVKVCS